VGLTSARSGADEYRRNINRARRRRDHAAFSARWPLARGLSNDWRDAIQTTFLPQLGDHLSRTPHRAADADPASIARRSSSRPALTPDGKEIAYFGDQGGFFIDLWLADAETGTRQAAAGEIDADNNYESLRFIHSAGAFSPMAAPSDLGQAQRPRWTW